MAKRRLKRSRFKSARSAKPGSRIGDRIDRAWRNLVLFAILFAFSLLLYSISASTLFLNLFGVLSILFGVIVLALIVVLAILFLVRAIRN